MESWGSLWNSHGTPIRLVHAALSALQNLCHLQNTRACTGAVGRQECCFSSCWAGRCPAAPAWSVLAVAWQCMQEHTKEASGIAKDTKTKQTKRLLFTCFACPWISHPLENSISAALCYKGPVLKRKAYSSEYSRCTKADCLKQC